MDYSIRYSCVSHVGKIRRKNQDNFLCGRQYLSHDPDNGFSGRGSLTSKDSPLFGVFDGLGGEECGEAASLIAAQCASRLRPGRDAAAALAGWCREANVRICDYAQEHRVSAMGTTAALLTFGRREVTLCNIGDSRIYRFSEGRLKQISRDHLAPAPYGRKAPLTQNLGIPPEELTLEPHIARFRCKPQDLYLICSDGLTDMVENKQLKELISATSVDHLAQRLLEAALDAGGRDNITIVCCRVEPRHSRLWTLLTRLSPRRNRS